MAGDRDEFEIKFTALPNVLAAIPDSALAYALIRGEGRWRRLQTTYYDTPNERLRRAGVGLRVRDDGESLRQGVKRRGAEGDVIREEFETPLLNGAGFPVLTNDADIDALFTSAADRLGPTVQFDIDRWSAAFPFRRSQLEIAVDLGSATIGPEENNPVVYPLAELELELIDGDPEDLFSVARLFLAERKLRLAAGTKLEAALSAAAGRRYAIPPRKRLTPQPEDKAGDLLARALALSADRIIALQPIILEAREPEGVHQMRVELRRLRALERTFRKAAPSGRLRALADKARAIACALGPARDWDVFIGETLKAADHYDYAVEGFAALKAEAMAHRAQGWARAVTTIGGQEFTAFALDLLRTAYAPSWRRHDDEKLERPAKAVATRALDRVLRKAKTVSRKIDTRDPAARHPLRVALKKLRYSVQLFRGLYPKERRKAYMASMASLQDALGAVNDAVVAQKLANEAAAKGGREIIRAAGFVAGLYAAKAEAAGEHIDDAWAAFEKMTPFWREDDV